MAIPRYSANPPMVAPIKFAPKQDEAFLLSRKVVEKIRPAKKTGKVILMCEDTHTGAFTADLSGLIAEEAFEYLDGPIIRLDHPDTPVPYSPPMEMLLRPNKEKLLEKIRELASY